MTEPKTGIRLGINIDHIATLREARKGSEPSPLEAAFVCAKAGAHGITVHLREDRRHIQDHDVFDIKKNVSLPLNLEMALNPDIISIALSVRPCSVCIVPEKRQELTTEGGLDAVKNIKLLKSVVRDFKKAGVLVSLFVSPDPLQIKASAESGADYIELNTGEYSNSADASEIIKLENAARTAKKMKLGVNAGHGLNYSNVESILHLEGLHELNIGHAIISRAVITGLHQAVRDMLALLS